MVTSGELWTQTWGTLRSSTWSHKVHNIYAETRNCQVLFCHNTKDFSQFLFVMHGPLLEVVWNTHLEILQIQFWCYLHPHSWPPVPENTKSKLLLIISFYQWCHVFFSFFLFLTVLHCKTLMSNSWLQSHQLIKFSDSNSAEGLLCSFKWATKGYCPNVFTECDKWKPQTTVYGNFQHHFSFKMNITY